MTTATIDVYVADLDALAPPLKAIEDALSLLSPAETEPSSWPGPPPVGQSKQLARILLRYLLARHGVTEARGTPFQKDVNGKPSLAGAGVHFNLSHTGHLALVAIGRLGPLGVDMELPRTVHLGAARRGLIIAAGHGVARTPLPLATGPEATSDCAFLIAWTRLEALAKAQGHGIGRLLTDLGITADGTHNRSPEQSHTRALEIVSATGSRVMSLDLSGPAAAALCAPAQELEGLPNCHILTPADITG